MPLYEFTQSARVTDADVATANEQWKTERDGDEFTNILEAKAD
jgi:frataxin-like iron-binding protein CyaY